MLHDYYNLTKPGIIYGNAITLLAGFFLASHGHINFWLLISALLGLSLVIASGCVFNNIMDRGLDAKMDRTKQRAIVTGKIPISRAVIFGTVLLILGVVVLWRWTNVLTLDVALIGWVVYVALYTLLKPKTVHATVIGSIAGATPPVVGYTAITNRFDLGALLLFLILVLWQMPHFYAIAIRRQNEYAAAGVPVLPIKSGVKFTKITMLIYIFAFTLAAVHLVRYHYAGYTYLVAALLLGLIWLILGLKGFGANDDAAWAKKMFLFSLVVLTVLSIALMFNAVLP